MASLIRERTTRKRKEIVIIPPNPVNLFESICEIMGESKERVKARCKKKELVKVRAIYGLFGRECKFSYREIGGVINREHADIIYHVKLYKDYLDEGQPWFRQDVKDEIDYIRRALKTRLNLR